MQHGQPRSRATGRCKRCAQAAELALEDPDVMRFAVGRGQEPAPAAANLPAFDFDAVVLKQLYVVGENGAHLLATRPPVIVIPA